MEYKLIKKYPSLPADWEVGMVVGIGDRCAPTCFSPCSGKYKDYYVPCGEVTGSPEYWEKVEEKTFEVLSYICVNPDGSHTTQIFNKTHDGRYSWESLTYSEDCIKKEFWNNERGGYVIHSVKRHSDGEVFTLGDKITSKYFTNDTPIRTILSFNIDSEYIVKQTGGKTKISDIEHAPKPLFTTHDGVDIYKGDECWAGDPVRGIGDFIQDTWEGGSSVMMYFSTKKAVEDYLIKDARFSLEDIKKVLDDHGFINSRILIETLKESIILNK